MVEFEGLFLTLKTALQNKIINTRSHLLIVPFAFNYTTWPSSANGVAQSE